MRSKWTSSQTLLTFEVRTVLMFADTIPPTTGLTVQIKYVGSESPLQIRTCQSDIFDYKRVYFIFQKQC